ncbi:MAG: GcrA cell cycle regulator [Devosia nanyangense]|uniref:GcrA cell cycle regulator n=1 Tax=Devosia nanyangense TaxID=1228055 RepID=A0A933L2F2_9HYPH|nr:GcrA cell cycle regulator [Devosia nanyangense]
MGWTEERVELLKKLWLEGLSASQIAGVLGEGVTRNAVIGKVHRLKLTGRAKPASSTPRARTAPRSSNGGRRVSTSSPGRSTSGIANMMKSRSMGGGAIQGATALKIQDEFEREVYVAPQVQELFIPVEQRLTLLQLSEATCKWPIGDPLTPDFYFCGQHSEDGKPYCDFHSRRAYHQLEKKKR